MTDTSRKRLPLFRYLADRFQRYVVVPRPRLYGWAAIGAVVVGIGYAIGFGREMLFLVNALLIVLTIYDLSRLPRRQLVRLARDVPEQCDIGHSMEAAIRLEYPTRLAVSFAAIDDVPQTFAGGDEPMFGRWNGKHAVARYRVTPQERGKYTFKLIRVRLWGGLGLWAKQINRPLTTEIKVVPDMTKVRGVLSSMHDYLTLDGKRIYRKERSGSEFHAVREHTPDDDPRLINWKATARTRKLMTNIFRPERGKVVIITLDCGRMTGVELFGRTKLDVNLEAALVLAAVALKQGDQVGVLAFSNRVKVYVPPDTGLSHLHVILDAVYDLKSDFVESGYGEAFAYLARVQKKRSMNVLFSDPDNDLFEDELLPHLERLRRNHYVLLLGMRDEVLHEWAGSPTASKREAFIKAIAHQFMMQRQANASLMESRGIEVVDVPADELALQAVNRYLDIRSRDVM